MTKTNPLRTTYNSLYHFYPLYEVTHGRPVAYKAYEAKVIKDLADELFLSGRCKALGKGLTILEQFAGRGEYYRAWWDMQVSDPSLVLNGYALQDISKPDNLVDDSIPYYTDDVCTFAPSRITVGKRDHDINLIIAPYYSINGMFGPNGERAPVVQWFKSAATALKTNGGGALYLAYSDSGDDTKVSESSDFPGEVYSINPGYALRDILGIKAHERGTVKMSTTRWYDRTTGINHEKFTGISFQKNGVDVPSAVKVKNTLSFKYWSEVEIVDMLREAGFKVEHAIFGSMDFGSANYMSLLDHKLHNVEDGDTAWSNCLIVPV